MDVDASGLRALAVDLEKAQSRSVPAVIGVVTKGATTIKTDWRQRWNGMRHAPALPDAVTFDLDVNFGLRTITAEIGPDKAKRQGALGNLIEFGSVKNPPRPGGLPAAQAEQPRFEQALTDLGQRLLGG